MRERLADFHDNAMTFRAAAAAAWRSDIESHLSLRIRNSSALRRCHDMRLTVILRSALLRASRRMGNECKQPSFETPCYARLLRMTAVVVGF
jgi:hypothetical protein